MATNANIPPIFSVRHFALEFSATGPSPIQVLMVLINCYPLRSGV
ncbi:hypothetical protein D082_18050 [Synechocystis sp. PCC 6714]|nr:hypothetical protein D082_18050 [Synechocystis sp. PCC 6714]